MRDEGCDNGLERYGRRRSRDEKDEAPSGPAERTRAALLAQGDPRRLRGPGVTCGEADEGVRAGVGGRWSDKVRAKRTLA